MQKLLIEANRVKIRGYKQVSLSFAQHVVNTLYGAGARHVAMFERKFRSSLSKEGEVIIAKYTSGLYSELKTLTRSDRNPVLKKIYNLAKINSSYKELAFVMFLMGVVDTRDFLVNFRDIGYIMDRVVVTPKYNRIVNTVDKRFSVSFKAHNDFMAVCFELATKGIDFGVHPLDFLYHILNHTWETRGSREYDYVIKTLQKMDMSSVDSIFIDEKLIDKYPEEIGVILPFMTETEDWVDIYAVMKLVMGKTDMNYPLYNAVFETWEMLAYSNVMSYEYL